MLESFAATTEEAGARFKEHQQRDPFHDIAPALLNSADIRDYVRTIGMVFPFEEENLLGATLRLKVGSTGVYWDEKKTKIRVDIEKEKEFVLKSNSIAFVEVKEELRLPAYIISRFNLRVVNAYRGILLGTGPIVDPGFVGKLFIPLHNLTNSDYVLFAGDTFIEMEFTKLSPNNLWDEECPRDGKYNEWKSSSGVIDPKKRDIDFYLRRANEGRSIQSSLPALTNSTNAAVEKASKTSEKVDASLSRINVGLLFSFGTLLGAIIAMINVFRGDIKEIKDKKYDDAIRILQKQHEKDSSLIDSLKKTVQYK